MDRNCDAFIRSNNTYDILIARESLEISDDRAECIQNIGEKFVAEYFDRDEVPQLSIRTYGYSIIPKCFDFDQFPRMFLFQCLIDLFLCIFRSVQKSLRGIFLPRRNTLIPD